MDSPLFIWFICKTNCCTQLIWFDIRLHHVGWVYTFCMRINAGKSASSPTSFENTLPVTLLATMWELFVKTLYRTGQWYFPGTKWRDRSKQSSRVTLNLTHLLQKSTSTSCNVLPHLPLDLICSCPLHKHYPASLFSLLPDFIDRIRKIKLI